MTTSRRSALKALLAAPAAGVLAGQAQAATAQAGPAGPCLLYTSDAADE